MDDLKKTPALRGAYITNALKDYFLNGDSYALFAEVYDICKNAGAKVSYEAFKEDMAEQFRLGILAREGPRIYLRRTLDYEDSAARDLAERLSRCAFPEPMLPAEMMAAGVPLCSEQREAVRLALSHRLSVILGGAGCGKTTLIQAIVGQFYGGDEKVLCAPTGKAARNLHDRTGYSARTVHSALGVHPDEDFLTSVSWPRVGLVIVDEASMMTLEMLAGILNRAPMNCHIVLLGDPNQLLSVGSGNVLPDLLNLGVPHILLKENHRQDDGARGLFHNVVGFSDMHSTGDLLFDESFELKERDEDKVGILLTDLAVRSYLMGENVQVISPYNRVTQLSVDKLNPVIRDRINRRREGKPELTFGSKLFRDGDRVIITMNDGERNCSNGDVGRLHIIDADPDNPKYEIRLPDGRCPYWDNEIGLKNLSLAYVLTVHKVQGSEADKILMPITNGFSSMLYRNLIYTAISRAKKQVILVGSRNALEVALQRTARVRRSRLVVKTVEAMVEYAGTEYAS